MTQPAPATRLRAMTLADVDGVFALEQRAYSFAWSRGNLIDSLVAGHQAWLLEPAAEPAAQPGVYLGYYIAMTGVEEMHLLNITVAPEHQGQGLARQLLAHLAQQCRAAAAPLLWLEVRQSNERARRLYNAWGFEAVGLRKNYYPAAQGQREHAVVMRWRVPAQLAGGTDALV